MLDNCTTCKHFVSYRELFGSGPEITGLCYNAESAMFLFRSNSKYEEVGEYLVCRKHEEKPGNEKV